MFIRISFYKHYHEKMNQIIVFFFIFYKFKLVKKNMYFNNLSLVFYKKSNTNYFFYKKIVVVKVTFSLKLKVVYRFTMKSNSKNLYIKFAYYI